MWGPTGLDPAVQRLVRQHDVVAPAGRAGHGSGAPGAHHPGPPHRPRASRRCCSGVGRSSASGSPSAWRRASSTPTTPSPSPRRSGALVGIATMGLWERRATWAGRVGLAAGLGRRSSGATCCSAAPRTGSPRSGPSCSSSALLGVVAILALPLLRSVPKLAVGLVAVLGLGAALAAPLVLHRGHRGHAAHRGHPVGDPDPGAVARAVPAAVPGRRPGGVPPRLPGGGFRRRPRWLSRAAPAPPVGRRFRGRLPRRRRRSPAATAPGSGFGAGGGVRPVARVAEPASAAAGS